MCYLTLFIHWSLKAVVKSVFWKFGCEVLLPQEGRHSVCLVTICHLLCSPLSIPEDWGGSGEGYTSSSPLLPLQKIQGDLLFGSWLVLTIVKVIGR